MKLGPGIRIGRFKLLEKVTSGAPSTWLAKCDCGTVKTIYSWSLNNGSVKHGASEHPECNIWWLIRDRCCNPRAYRNIATMADAEYLFVERAA